MSWPINAKKITSIAKQIKNEIMNFIIALKTPIKGPMKGKSFNIKMHHIHMIDAATTKTIFS